MVIVRHAPGHPAGVPAVFAVVLALQHLTAWREESALTMFEKVGNQSCCWMQAKLAIDLGDAGIQNAFPGVAAIMIFLRRRRNFAIYIYHPQNNNNNDLAMISCLTW